MLLVILGVLWHIFPITSMLLLAPYGKKWEGFYISLFFGPVGLIAVILMRKKLEAERLDREADSAAAG
jgi:hypothetical protein